MDERVIQNALGKISQVAQQIKQSAYNVFSPQPQPLRQPEGNMVATKWGNIPFKGPQSGQVMGGTTPSIQPSATPVPTQQPANDPNFRFAYEQLPRDQYYAMNGPRPNFQPNQPPADIGNVIRDVFPNEATKAAGLAVTENSQFDPKRKDAINYDKKTGKEKSRDRGLFQINDKTFATEMSKFGDELRGMGINNYEDMYDARKNALFAKHLYDTYGAGRWFGWQDTGYDLKGGLFSAPLRGLYAEYKKTMSPEKALKTAKKELGIE